MEPDISVLGLFTEPALDLQELLDIPAAGYGETNDPDDFDVAVADVVARFPLTWKAKWPGMWQSPILMSKGAFMSLLGHLEGFLRTSIRLLKVHAV